MKTTQKAIAITYMLLNIGSGLLSDGWGRHPASGRRRDSGSSWPYRVFEISVFGFSFILRKNHHRGRADTDYAGTGKPIDLFLTGFDIGGGMIGKIRAIII